MQSCLSNQHSICNGKIKIQSTIPAQNLIDMLSRNGKKQIYYDLKCTHWHNISHFISQITISTRYIHTYSMLLTLSQKGHAKFVFSCPYLVQVAPIEWIVYLQLHLQPLNVWTLVNQSISIRYQKLKNRSILVGSIVPYTYNKSRLFWFPEKYQKSNLWELGGLTAAALSYSRRIFTGLLHSESFILVNH